MAIEVFNRYEKKYMMDEKTFYELTDRISDYMSPDAYNKNGEAYRISNIYYDTESDQLIRASIEKPVYKEKLRLRAYGTPSLDDMVFVEIKKKYNGIVNKRRTSMTLKEAYSYLDEGTMPDMNNNRINRQVLKEIDYFKNFYGLKPKLYLSYDRFAYFEKDDGAFRVTFDKNITTRRDDVRLEHGSYGDNLLAEGQYLMEIKISGAVPLWFAKIISGLNIYPVSFSKYGTEYKHYVLANYTRLQSEGEIICLNPSLQQQQRIQSALVSQCQE